MARPLRTSIVTILFAAGVVLAVPRAQQPAAKVQRVPVLAELFTSEGCSSCPPADDLLKRLIEEQPVEGVEVIGLSEHVDYWDRLGWKDPFSSSDFTRRQEEYGRALRLEPIYTPQLIIDGKSQAIGSEWPDVRKALIEAARAPRAVIAVTAEAQPSASAVTVSIVVRDLPAATVKGDVDVFVAIVEDNLTSEVLRGENARKQLHHSAVTRSLTKIGSLGKTETAGEFSRAVPRDGSWRPEHLRAIAFLQDRPTRHVVGAGTAHIRRGADF